MTTSQNRVVQMHHWTRPNAGAAYIMLAQSTISYHTEANGCIFFAAVVLGDNLLRIPLC